MEFVLTEYFLVDKKTLFFAWIDSQIHSEMTGGKAVIQPEIGTAFTAWDGYISGKNVALIPSTYILQSWRTTEFEADQMDSSVEIFLEDDNGNTRLTLKHSNLREEDIHYKQGWIDHYFEPMKKYFQ